PDRGRYGWRRNTDPPDQPRANHRHRIAELLDHHRQAEPGPCGEPGVPDTRPVVDPWANTAESTAAANATTASADVERDEPPADMELQIAYLLVERLPRPTITTDVTWPRCPAIVA
ncbi:hypothetical protein, partial [Williamsia sp.]|uniref:hypothetical protein n=1 Tax=Williamsia sp. TaxID=1872085 RepID=UPI001A2C4A9A